MVNYDFYPTPFRINARTAAISQQLKIGYTTFIEDKGTSFMGKYTMTTEELEHMIH